MGNSVTQHSDITGENGNTLTWQVGITAQHIDTRLQMNLTEMWHDSWDWTQHSQWRYMWKYWIPWLTWREVNTAQFHYRWEWQCRNKWVKNYMTVTMDTWQYRNRSPLTSQDRSLLVCVFRPLGELDPLTSTMFALRWFPTAHLQYKRWPMWRFAR